MLVEMPAGKVTQGVNRAVISLFPAVNVLQISLILEGRLNDTKPFSIFNK